MVVGANAHIGPPTLVNLRTQCHCESLGAWQSGLRCPAEPSLDDASSLLADRCPLLRSLVSATGSAPIAIRNTP